MKASYEKKTIVGKEEIGSRIFRLDINTQAQVRPGQFYMLRGWTGLDPFLSRAISVADYKEGVLSFIIEAKGLGTQLLSRVEVGQTLEILGPLGQGFRLDGSKKLALVGGGVGLAPLLYLAKELDYKPDLYVGFRDQAYLLDEFKDYVDRIEVASDSGATGHKGLVTDLIDPDDYELIMACGPMGMIESLAQLNSGRAQLEVSLENNMACGIGACMGCSVETQDGMETVCKDGPVFNESRLVL